MTRWKRERPEPLLTMHAHNRWSQWGMATLDAAAELGVPVCERTWRQDDGSVSSEWLVPRGTLDAITARARELHRERLDY